MKYEDNRSAGLPKKTMRMLEQIAMKACYSLESRGGIESRDNDAEDFPEVSILGIQKMLEDAYKMGKEDAAKTQTNGKTRKVGYRTNGSETTYKMTAWYFGEKYLQSMTQAAILMTQADGQKEHSFFQENTGKLTIRVE